jgi:hypothetical protein
MEQLKNKYYLIITTLIKKWKKYIIIGMQKIIFQGVVRVDSNFRLNSSTIRFDDV